jgi:ACS family sodium-dependent inorganic phosphate cotransporter-like MFS transporter 5
MTAAEDIENGKGQPVRRKQLQIQQQQQQQHQDPETTSPISFGSFVCSTRFALAIICFFVCFNLYAQRIGMSVAIVCMVNHTAVAEMRLQSAASSSSSSLTSAVISSPSGDLAEDDDEVANIVLRCSRDDTNGSNTEHASMDGPFPWPKHIQGHVLSAFFYGYLASQIPGGLLAERFGAKWVLFGFLGVSTIGTLLTPVAARVSVSALIVLRIAAGFGSGALFPGMHAMWGQWAPPLERSQLAMLSYAGSMLGSVVAMPLSGFLCQYGFDDGWGSVFYTIGISSAIFLILWAILVSDTPSTNRFISDEEKSYITTSLSKDLSGEKLSWRDMPWRRFATSGPVWAIIVTNFCMDWGGYTLMTNMPTFYYEVLKFDIKSNGLYSALPFLALWVISNVSSVVADRLRSSGLLSTTATRKVFTSVGLLGCALFLVGLSFIDCTQTTLAVALLTIGFAMGGVSLSGFWVNHMDIAPRYAGTLMGISNGVAATSGFIAPLVAASLTTDQTRESWQKVFFISAAIYVFGTLVYLVLGSGVIQPWAVGGDMTVTTSIEVALESRATSPQPSKNAAAGVRSATDS